MKTIRYIVLQEATTETTLERFMEELQYLNTHQDIETTLIILPNQFENFEKYLDLIGFAEALNSQKGYDGIYQVASFHPDYLFAGSTDDDPANYTNRSPYPMVHILREDSVTRAIEHYPNTEEIPQRNIDFANQKGLNYMQMLRAACLTGASE